MCVCGPLVGAQAVRFLQQTLHIREWKVLEGAHNVLFLYLTFAFFIQNLHKIKKKSMD